MIKLIASDMDGTLLDDAKCIDPGIYEILPKLMKKGVRFIAASGRQYPSLLKSFYEFRKDIVIIAENGAFVVEDGKELYASVMSKDLISRCLQEIEKIPNAKPMLCGKYKSYTDNQEMYDVMVSDQFQYDMELVADIYHIQEEIIKVSVLDLAHGGATDNSFPTLQKIFTEEAEMAVSGFHCMDIVNKGVSKGRAIQVLQEKWGISPKETASFGDNFNDIEMLQQAEYSFAMAHAHKDVKKHARFITGSNNDGCVVKEICKLTGV